MLDVVKALVMAELPGAATKVKKLAQETGNRKLVLKVVKHLSLNGSLNVAL